MKEKLLELNFNESQINELLIKSRKSINIAYTLEILEINHENSEIIKDLILFILEIDSNKPVSVNVKDLSNILGLSVRKINDLRKEKRIPFIKLSGEENKPGRKTYLYQIEKVKKALEIT